MKIGSQLPLRYRRLLRNGIKIAHGARDPYPQKYFLSILYNTNNVLGNSHGSFQLLEEPFSMECFR